MNDSIPCVVIDLGECYTKIGQGNEDVPRAIVPSVFSNTSDNYIMWAAENSKLEHYYGFDASRREGLIRPSSFFNEDRQVAAADVFGKFVHHTMVESFDSSETANQGVIVLDKPDSSIQSKKELAEVLLEWNKF